MKQLLHISFFMFLLIACSSKPPRVEENIEKLPDIFPDYTYVTIPENIAPLNFKIHSYSNAWASFETTNYSFSISTTNGFFSIPTVKWKKLISEAKGKDINIKIIVNDASVWKSFQAFTLSVAKDKIDPYIAYRLIAPGHQLWGKMGIYQRELSSFHETPILENTHTDNNCMNCHSFCMQNPSKMLLHIRAKHACTVFINDNQIETFNTKTDQTMSALVYPSWHPTGKYIAFSVNNTTQDVHPLCRTEVYDKASDVVIYDTEKQEIFTTGTLFSPTRFETFPTFSPDGNQLYFCTAPALSVPDSIKDLRYSLCRITFDTKNRTLGAKVDTLFNAETERKSILFPCISPDGKYLLCTLTDYGTFPIWHKDADLIMFDLQTGKQIPCNAANSEDTDSYHSWSSNSKWIIFSSRRLDGLYTRLFIAYVKENGELSKPFLLPQQSDNYYTFLMQSYNVPEFIKGKVELNAHALASKIKQDINRPVRFVTK